MHLTVLCHTVHHGVSFLCVYVTCIRDVCFTTRQACSLQYVKWVARQLTLLVSASRTLHLSLQYQMPSFLVHELKPCHHCFSDACIPPSTHNHGEEGTMQVSISVNCNICFSPPVPTPLSPYYLLVICMHRIQATSVTSLMCCSSARQRMLLGHHMRNYSRWSATYSRSCNKRHSCRG